MPARPAAALSVPLALLLPLCACVTNVQQNAAMQQSAPAAAMMHTAAITGPPPGSLAAKADVGKLPEVDHSYRGEVTFLDRRTPLPDGEWTVIATSKTAYHDGRPPAGGVMLLRHQGNVLTGLIYVIGNKVPRETAGFPVSGVCTASDVIWSDARTAEPGGQQDCAAITFNRTAHWRDASAAPAFRVMAKALDGHDVTPPPVLIGAVFAVANPRYNLLEDVWLNPDLAGITPDLSTYRSQSDWASFNLSRDQRKQAYVERLKAWSAGWRRVLKKVIDGERWSLPRSVAATP